MKGRFHFPAQVFAMLLVGAAMLLRLAVPAGWMPAQADDGSIRISLCTGYGTVEAVLAADGTVHTGSDIPDQEKQAPQQQCPFTAAAMPLAGADPVGLSAVPPHDEIRPVGASFVAVPGRGLAAPPPPATGPPVLV